MLLVPGLAAQTPTSLTIYNDGRVLVRRELPVEIRKGESELLLPLGPVDPGTVLPLDGGIEILGGSYDGGVDLASVYRRAVGRRLTFRLGKDTVSAVLAGVNPERYKLADGTISFSAPGTPQFPADLVTLDPTYRIRLRSAQAASRLRLGYFTQGGGWNASYQLLLGGGGAGRLFGTAVVDGGGIRLEGVEVQLLAGQVSQAPASYAPRREEMLGRTLMAKEADGVPSQQKVGEFHLYTLPGRHTLNPGVTTTVGLFEPAEAPVIKTFEMQGQLPWWGGLPQMGEEEEVRVSVIYTVKRPYKTPLGDRPMPGGVVRLFEPDSAGRLQLIGESGIDHSPAGEDLRLGAGEAFDLAAKRVQATYTTRRDSLPQGGCCRTIATADYRVTITNAGEVPATVDVLEQRGGEWSVVSSSIKGEKLSSTRTRFRVPVPAKGKATLTYRVRVIW
jgi:hypothetical protein